MGTVVHVCSSTVTVTVVSPRVETKKAEPRRWKKNEKKFSQRDINSQFEQAIFHYACVATENRDQELTTEFVFKDKDSISMPSVQIIFAIHKHTHHHDQLS